MKRIKLSLIIPCYNEEKNLSLIVEQLKAHLQRTDLEIILVDNGSRDNSNKVIQDLSRKFPAIKLVTVKDNKGYGFGILSGLKEAKGEYVGWTHADMQTDPKDIFRAYNLIIQQKNPLKSFVKGKRYGRPLFDIFFTFGMTVFETILMKKFLYDINAQPNFFHKSFLNKLKNPPKDFSFDLYAYYIAKKNNYSIIRFPVFFGKRAHGKSTWNDGIKSRIKFIKRTINFSFKLKKELN